MERIIDVLKADTNYYTFLQMLKSTGLYETLSGKGPFTIFVPENEAFGKIPSDNLFDIMNRSKLMKRIVSYHILYGAHDSNSLSQQEEIPTLLGPNIVIKSGDILLVEKARVIKSDISASNGIIHIVDRLITPPEILAAV